MRREKTFWTTMLWSWSLLWLMTGPVWGQATRGVIVGRVTDPSAAVVHGAKVALLNENTGISTETTASTGDYTFTNVEPGIYKVSVSAQGFKTGVVRNVNVFVDQTIRVDVKLEVGEVATQIEVEATLPVVQSETSSVGSVVDGRQITSLPLNGRAGILGLMILAPGVQKASINPMVAGGAWFGAANMTVDGVANIDVGNERILPLAPSLESIGEFKVIANGAAAEYGRGGSQVVVVSKSGTNDVHGSLFAFNRNRALSAKHVFATHLPKPSFNRNEFGGSVGGPIIRNKLFYFGNFEGLRRRVSSTTVHAMPTVALKAGDFSGLAPIRDPFSGQPFPNNRIPTERFSAVSRELLKFTSDPNGPGTGAAGLGNNFTVNVPTRESYDRYSVRIDSQLTSNDKITGRFYRADNGPFISGVGTGTDKFGNWGGFGTATRNALGSYTRVMSPTMVNEARFGFVHTNYFRQPQNFDFDPSKLIPGLISPVSGLGGLPTVSVTGFRGFFDQPGSGDRQRSWEAADTLSWTRRAHTIKAGFDFQRASSFNFQNPPPIRGTFNFDGRYSGHPFADFLLGTTSATGRVSKNVEAEPQNSRYAAFVQDDWNATPNLTLNLGLRYEYAGLFVNGRGDMANFYPNLGKVVVLRGTGEPRLLATLPIVDGQSVGLDPGNYLNKDRNNFAPRLGFAFRPFGTTRFVVRGSYGIFYNVIGGYSGNFQVALNPPFLVAETFEPAPGAVPSLTFERAFPGVGNIPASPGLNAISANRRNPYHQQWNFTLEHEVLPNTAVRASYVGNKGTHLERLFNLNDPPPAPGAVQPRRPYQPFGPITYYESGRDAITHQLQLGALRRFSSGVAFQFEYQFTKALGEQIHILAPMDNRNTRLDRGNLDTIRQHFAAINYIYDLPFGRGKRYLSSTSGLAAALLGGWQIAGISTFGSGEPYSVTFTSTVLGWPSSRADIIGNPKVNDPTTQRWFNPTAFAVPSPFNYGNSARNMLFGPGFFNWDAALFKNTQLTERLRLEFRAEFFNILNHPNFGVPASNISVPATVGRISSATDPRDIQFGLRLVF
ncbi:MAG: TonB-dependent receptor [Acidobacteria bacterium]|nr:TonB-dependent receptor [Acidobacteriota bacterium]MCI0719407.1 TonB-dependent receptor [Acidobacteriota bacterium]